MKEESVVYGCIKDTLVSSNTEESHSHRENNRQVMMELPSVEDLPLLSREMFSMPVRVVGDDAVQTDVMHFGTSYKSVEYEWQQWMDSFEKVLDRMYWVSAVVHLETEFNGRHTFIWESDNGMHEPNAGNLSVRCEWSHEVSAF
jgi:hypothetical protein